MSEVPNFSDDHLESDLSMPTNLVVYSGGLPRTSLGYVKEAEQQMYALEHDAEHNWTLEECLGAILDHLVNIEGFGNSVLSAQGAQRQTDWQSRVLIGSTKRAELAGLRPGRIQGVIDALIEHSFTLGREGNIHAPSVQKARELVRMEISYLGSSSK